MDLDKFGRSDDCLLRITARVTFDDVKEPLVLKNNYFYLFCSTFHILLHVSPYAVLDFGIRHGQNTLPKLKKKHRNKKLPCHHVTI